MKTRYLFLGLLLSVFLLNGCTKSYYRDNGTTKLPYVVGGLSDFTISEIVPQHNILLDISHNSGEQENVKLSIEGLPAGITAVFLSTSGYPPLTSNIIISDSMATPGTYLLKVIVTGSISGRKEFPITMTVAEVPNCALALAGNYMVFGNCAGGNYSDDVTNDPVIAKRIHIRNFENLGIDIYGTVNCGLTTIIVPRQTAGGYTIEGDGGFNIDPISGRAGIYISYEKTSAAGTNNCYLTMSK